MKRKKTKEKQTKKNLAPALPQNILPIGERVFDDKNIYIHQNVYAQIHKFAANKTENEYGGILVGRVLNEMGKENTIIEGFIEAKYNAATPTTLTFTHETWDYFHNEIDKKHKGKNIVGWIHTHPNFGIFLSENDRFIQENFFTDVNQVAYVVDPIQNDEGFFFWVNEKLERCPGFYLYDKNGVKIKHKPCGSGGENGTDESSSVKNGKEMIFSFILAILLIINVFMTFSQSTQIKQLEQQVDDLSIIIRYNIYGGMYADYRLPEVSDIADSVRAQIKIQKNARKKALQDSQANQSEAEDETETETESGTETKSQSDYEENSNEPQIS